MNESIIQAYARELDKIGIKSKFLKHPPMREVKNVMDYLGYPISEGFSTLVMKADGEYVAIIRRDDCQLSLKKAKKALKVGSLTIATGEEFEQFAGLPSGAAHILLPVKQTILDAKLFEKDYLMGGSGSLSYTCKYLSHQLKKIPNSFVADVVTETQSPITIKRVLSGITPSGNQLHIGNYFGAVKPQFDLQNQVEASYYFVADLHALTTVQDRERLENNIINNVLDYIALGLDIDKSAYFRQSDVVQHSQLEVVLANYVSFGLTNRMHAFKDKLAKGVSKESINMGLFNYPILMAADILLYKPDGVPVGEDQRQHIEYAREVARSFNKVHGDTFPLPEPVINSDNSSRLIGTDGERKMSKSLGNTIDIFSDYNLIKKQIMGSYTDPNRKHATDPGTVEGNPVFIYHDLINQNKEEVADLKDRYRAGKVGDVEVKEKLLLAHQKLFGLARERRQELSNNMNLVKDVLSQGAALAHEFAYKTINEVYEIIGICNQLNQ